MAEEKDFMSQAVEEWLGVTGEEPKGEKPQTEPVQPETVVPAGETVPVETPVQQPAIQIDSLSEFNKITGLNFKDLEQVKSFVEIYKKAPEIEEQAKILPELVDAVEKLQNPLNFFKDETAFKIAQLGKDARYHGKEDVLNDILRNDLEKTDDLKVIELASRMKAREGVRNPLRAELRSMGIDPDEVLENYETLDDDTKDLLKIKADQYRDELPKIGEGIKAPSFEGTIVQQILNQKKAAKEDLDARMVQAMPVAKGIISQIKDIKVTDDFSFKLDLSPDEINSYSEELAELLVSGQYDISTDTGKREIYGAILDMFKSDYFDKAVSSLVSYQKTKIEEDMRRKMNNEQPLKKEEPNPFGETQEKDIITRAAELLVSRGY